MNVTQEAPGSNGGNAPAVVEGDTVYNRGTQGVSSRHDGLVQVSYGDGSTHSIPDSVESYYELNGTDDAPATPIDLKNDTSNNTSAKQKMGVWERLCAINDGQVVNNLDF